MVRAHARARPREPDRPLQPRPDLRAARRRRSARRAPRRCYTKYKPDDNARDRAIAIARARRPRRQPRRRGDRDLRPAAAGRLRAAGRRLPRRARRRRSRLTEQTADRARRDDAPERTGSTTTTGYRDGRRGHRPRVPLVAAWSPASVVVLVGSPASASRGWLRGRAGRAAPSPPTRRSRSRATRRRPRSPSPTSPRPPGIAFVHHNGAYGEKLLPETMGGGVAFFDYDGDGDQDLLLRQLDALARGVPAGCAARRARALRQRRHGPLHGRHRGTRPRRLALRHGRRRRRLRQRRRRRPLRHRGRRRTSCSATRSRRALHRRHRGGRRRAATPRTWSTERARSSTTTTTATSTSSSATTCAGRARSTSSVDYQLDRHRPRLRPADQLPGHVPLPLPQRGRRHASPTSRPRPGIQVDEPGDRRAGGQGARRRAGRRRPRRLDRPRRRQRHGAELPLPQPAATARSRRSGEASGIAFDRDGNATGAMGIDCRPLPQRRRRSASRSATSPTR